MKVTKSVLNQLNAVELSYLYIRKADIFPNLKLWYGTADEDKTDIIRREIGDFLVRIFGAR